MILVSEAGWRCASAATECRTVPELPSTTMSEYRGSSPAGSLGVGLTERRWERASDGSLDTARTEMAVTRLKTPQRSPRRAPTPLGNMLPPSLLRPTLQVRPTPMLAVPLLSSHGFPVRTCQ